MKTNRSYTQYIENKGTILRFGKHRGETVRQVLRNDPGYILWLYENHVASLPNDIIFEAEDAVSDLETDGVSHTFGYYFGDDD